MPKYLGVKPADSKDIRLCSRKVGQKYIKCRKSSKPMSYDCFINKMSSIRPRFSYRLGSKLLSISDHGSGIFVDSPNDQVSRYDASGSHDHNRIVWRRAR